MKLTIESKLGHTVEHEVDRTGMNRFTGRNGCRIILAVRGDVVSLVGGYGPPPRDPQPHYYNHMPTIGRLVGKAL